MAGVIGRGLAAGAVGTTVLTTVTYLDMAVRGRPASAVPEKVIDALAGAAGRTIAGRGGARDNRRTALGALAGIATGLVVGVGTSAARAGGVRLPAALAAVATGAVAMAASDLPIAGLGVSDPRDWTRADWVADAVPHLAYGLATHAVLGLGRDADPPAATVQLRPTAGLILRSLLLGVATGSRSSLGLADPALSGPDGTGGPGNGGPGTRGPGTRGPTRRARVARAVAAAAVVGELVGDKLPATPSRLAPPGLQLRLVAGGAGGTAMARRTGARVTLPALAGIAGAAAGSYGGAAWRARAARGRPDWQGAIVEDALALTLAALACRSAAVRQPDHVRTVTANDAHAAFT